MSSEKPQVQQQLSGYLMGTPTQKGPSSPGSTPNHTLPKDLEWTTDTDSSRASPSFTEKDEGQLLRSRNDIPLQELSLETQAPRQEAVTLCRARWTAEARPHLDMEKTPAVPEARVGHRLGTVGKDRALRRTDTPVPVEHSTCLHCDCLNLAGRL